MAFNTDDIRANRDYLLEKLRAEKQRSDVLHAVEGTTPFDFLLSIRAVESRSPVGISPARCARPSKS